MDLENLRELGLSQGQIAVYSAVLELGTCTLKQIQDKTSMERRNIYDVLNKLIEKGLVIYTLEQGKKVYQCTHPNKIKEDIIAKKNALEKLEKQMPQITSLFEDIKPETRALVFRGNDSIKALLNEALQYEATYWIGGSSGIEQTNLKAWFKDWMEQRTKQKKIMYDLSSYGTHLEDYKPNEYYKYCTLPQDLRQFNVILVFGNKVAQILWDKQPFAFVLESKEIKESYMKFFNHFWEESEVEKAKLENPIKIGVLHSLTGTMAISESSVTDATLMAVDQINQQGGVLGRKIECVVVDGKSDWETFAKEAEKLISEEKVCSVFGGWTSASRKTMKPVFEKYNHLLWYPVQYEGLEQSSNVVYLGATPNQQVLPALEWASQKLGKKFFLVGSDYVFPHSANEIIKQEAEKLGIKLLGEEYKILGDTNFKEIVKKIKQTKPDFIFNTINGDSNIAFFKELRKKGITPDKIPTISVSMAEDEIRHLDANTMAGDYAAWSYFQSIDNPKNKEFVKDFKQRYGPHRVTSDAMEKAFLGVHLFARAVEKAGTDDVGAIREAVKGLSFNAPEGLVSIDPKTKHLTQTARIGSITKEGQFEIIWTSKRPINPEPYPKFNTKEQWEVFLDKLYNNWGNKWANED